MKISAPNALKGKITAIKKGAVMAQVTVDVGGGAKVVSAIFVNSSKISPSRWANEVTNGDQVHGRHDRQALSERAAGDQHLDCVGAISFDRLSRPGGTPWPRRPCNSAGRSAAARRRRHGRDGRRIAPQWTSVRSMPKDRVHAWFSTAPLQRRPEARPARAAVELGRRGEQGEVAAGAGEDAGAMLLEQRAGPGRLGALLAQDRRIAAASGSLRHSSSVWVTLKTSAAATGPDPMTKR